MSNCKVSPIIKSSSSPLLIVIEKFILVVLLVLLLISLINEQPLNNKKGNINSVFKKCLEFFIKYPLIF